MKKPLLAAAIAIALVTVAPLVVAQTSSTSTGTGGTGGTGGSAAGGTATGGTASNETSGVSNARGGTATGGYSSASGGYVGSVSTGGSTASLGDVTVNFNSSPGAMGKEGLGVGVDPTTGHIVTDNTVNYQGSYKVKNTPDISVGGPASGPCNGFSGGIGLSMAGIGIGANASTVDEGCSARETARVAAMIGRMDVANAVLEYLPIVQAAMKAKATREALALPPKSSQEPATTAPAQLVPAPVPVAATQQQREAALREQQRLAQEALQRQATMAKATDTLKFTDATTQGNDKTPQEIMAEEATKKLAADTEESKKYQASASPAQQALAQVSKADPAPAAAAPAALPQASKAEPAPAAAAPLALQQTSKTEPMTPAHDVKNPAGPQVASANAKANEVVAKGPPAAQPSEERIRAVKAALSLQ